MTYNRNSSITCLTRTGNSQAGYGNMDILAYSYTGNHLKSIQDMGSSNVYDGAFEFVNGASTTQEYWYNNAGDLTRDKNKGIALINYDVLGHPTSIQFTNGNITQYVYAADGRKLRTKQTTAVEGITVAYGFAHELTQAETMDVDSTDYFNGSFVIHWNVMGRNLDYHFGSGYLSLTPYFYRPYPFAPVILKHASSYHYYLRDHLGNNRLVVSGDGTVEQTNEYYPYGGPWGDASTNQGFQPYKYTGKELDRVHGLDWYDYGARRYDPAVGLFTQIDPLCEQYPHLSPYAYCAGNPVNAIDPDGMDWYQSRKTAYYTWYEGDIEREGYTHIGGKGSVLGEFESIINNILCGKEGMGLESLYSNGFTFDIAPIDKGGLIGSKERGWDFFDEFVNGSGPEFSVLLDNHKYTQAIKKDRFAIESQNVVRARGKEGKYTNVGRPEFFPWQASLFSPMQFIGTYRYDGLSSKDGRYIYNVVTDSKSLTSLLFHFPFLNNHRRSQRKLFSNTYQFYIWESIK